jgi:hypothetical protein
MTKPTPTHCLPDQARGPRSEVAEQSRRRPTGTDCRTFWPARLDRCWQDQRCASGPSPSTTKSGMEAGPAELGRIDAVALPGTGPKFWQRTGTYSTTAMRRSPGRRPCRSSHLRSCAENRPRLPGERAPERNVDSAAARHGLLDQVVRVACPGPSKRRRRP